MCATEDGLLGGVWHRWLTHFKAGSAVQVARFFQHVLVHARDFDVAFHQNEEPEPRCCPLHDGLSSWDTHPLAILECLRDEQAKNFLVGTFMSTAACYMVPRPGLLAGLPTCCISSRPMPPRR